LSAELEDRLGDESDSELGKEILELCRTNRTGNKLSSVFVGLAAVLMGAGVSPERAAEVWGGFAATLKLPMADIPSAKTFRKVRQGQCRLVNTLVSMAREVSAPMAICLDAAKTKNGVEIMGTASQFAQGSFSKDSVNRDFLFKHKKLPTPVFEPVSQESKVEMEGVKHVLEDGNDKQAQWRAHCKSKNINPFILLWDQSAEEDQTEERAEEIRTRSDELNSRKPDCYRNLVAVGSDNAASAKEGNRDFSELLMKNGMSAEEAGFVLEICCLNHVRAIIEKDMLSSDAHSEYLSAEGSWGQKMTVQSLANDFLKFFGKAKHDRYYLGKAAELRDECEEECESKGDGKKGKTAGLKNNHGSRHDAKFENGLSFFYLEEKCEELVEGSENGFGKKIDRLLGEQECLDTWMVMAIWWVRVLWPLRWATNATDVEGVRIVTGAEFAVVAKELLDVFEAAEKDGSVLLKEGNTFSNGKIQAAWNDYWKGEKRWAKVLATLESEDDEERLVLLGRRLASMARAAIVKVKLHFVHYLVGEDGAYTVEQAELAAQFDLHTDR
jgi:hypothetical protein